MKKIIKSAGYKHIRKLSILELMEIRMKRAEGTPRYEQAKRNYELWVDYPYL